MENASKALIIAGAILLAIIIISLGLMVVNNARNQIGGSNLNKQEIEAFNSQWDQYVGNAKSAAEVRSLCSAIIANNAAETQTGKNRFVAFGQGTTGATTVLTAAPTVTMPTATQVNNSNTYDVVAGYGSNGLIVSLVYSTHSST